MKQFLILFCFLVEVLASDAIESCNPWPSNVRTLRECCDIPKYSSSSVQHICKLKCFATIDEDKDCPINCYLNQTMLIKNGTIDKTVAKRIYNFENDDPTMFIWDDKINNNLTYEWQKIIEEGLEKCEYIASESVTQSLAKFYDCVSDHLSENCVKFRFELYCEKTERFFDKCKLWNCTEYPSSLPNPASCCQTPEPISETVSDECRLGCRQKEFFKKSQMECENNCKVDALFTTDDKIDFELVKKFLIENSNGKEIWEKPIASAVEKCEKVVAGLENGKESRMIIVDHLRQCLKSELSEECVEYQTDKQCNKVKGFISHCPDTKPTNQTSA